MSDPYPLLYTDGAGTRMVVVEPGRLTDRHWYGASCASFYDVYTPLGLQWLNPGAGLGRAAPNSPIGSRFD